MITASDIILRVSTTLNDLGLVRWPEGELLRSINDGQQVILEAKPDLFEVTAPVAVQVGVKQDVPDDCYMLLDVIRVIGALGTVCVPRRIDREVVDRQVPNWMGMETCTVIEHWMQNDNEREHFYVVPPIPVDGHLLELRYAKYPVKVANDTDELSLPEEHINTLYYFCVMRMLEKDEKFSGSPQAARFGQMFAQAMAARGQGDQQAFTARITNEGV